MTEIYSVEERESRITFIAWRLIYAMAIILLLGAALLAGRWMLADIIVGNLKWNLDVWEQSWATVTEDEWDAAMAQLALAQRFNKNDAEYFELEGALEAKRTFVGEKPWTVAELNDSLEKSIESYRIAASLRPSWPDSWALLAKHKSAMKQFDDEFALALANTVELGSWEPRIQMLIIEIAFNSWSYIKNPEKQQIAIAIERGLAIPRTARLLTHFLRFGGLLQQICPFLDTSNITERAAAACERSYI